MRAKIDDQLRAILGVKAIGCCPGRYQPVTQVPLHRLQVGDEGFIHPTKATGIVEIFESEAETRLKVRHSHANPFLAPKPERPRDPGPPLQSSEGVGHGPSQAGVF